MPPVVKSAHFWVWIVGIALFSVGRTKLIPAAGNLHEAFDAAMMFVVTVAYFMGVRWVQPVSSALALPVETERKSE